jgi:cytoskeletal protein CcmA (bactofilin family)
MPEALNTYAPPSRRIAVSDQETTYLAANTVLKGELQLAGPGTIAGRVEGAISGENPVQVMGEGSVEGDIKGTVVDIQGTVKGNIMATELCRLGATARVSGELRAANLAIVEGACFVGQVCVGGPSMEQELRKVEAPQAARPQPPRLHSIPQASVVQEMAAASNRIASLTNQAEEIAEAASAGADAVGNVNIMQDNIQNALNRGPKIIRARS